MTSKRLFTVIAGCRHGTDGISGDEEALAECGEPFLHLSDQFVDGVHLLPSTQRHTLCIHGENWGLTRRLGTYAFHLEFKHGVKHFQNLTDQRA